MNKESLTAKLLDLAEGRETPETWQNWWDEHETELEALLSRGEFLKLKPRRHGFQWVPVLGSQKGAIAILEKSGTAFEASNLYQEQYLAELDAFCKEQERVQREKQKEFKTNNPELFGRYLYKLDPYALEWKNDHYYLIGFSHKHQRMAHFRVDRLSGIKILPSGFTPDEDFDVAGYTNKIVDMFAADRTVSVELLCENKLMKTIIDHYGEAVPTRTYDEEHFTANIEVDPSGTFYGWVFKFMGGIQIIAPQECIEEMKRIAHRFL